MSKNLPLVIVSVVFAILLWFWINMKQEYQASVEIPVIPKNIRSGKALLKPLPQRVTTEFKAGGWQLAGLYFFSNLSYELDLINVEKHVDVVTNQRLNERVKSPSGVQAIRVEPDTISVFLDDYVEKTVPVVPQLDIAFRENYGQVGKTVVEPESITIGGARSILKDLGLWELKPQRLSDVKSDINTVAELSDSLSSILTSSHRWVRLRVNVQRIAEQEFKGIEVKVYGVPETREVILIPPQVDLLVRGGVEQLALLDRSDFSISVDYRSILLDTSGKIEPEVSAPEGLRIIQRVPERFQYVIRKKYAPAK